MLTPVVRILKKRFPQSKIDLCLTHDYVKDAFNGHPFFDDIITFDFYWKGYKAFFDLKNREKALWRVFFYHPRLFLKIALRSYDLSIDYSLSPEMKNLAGALAYAVSYPKANRIWRKYTWVFNRTRLIVNRGRCTGWIITFPFCN